jgi:tellurite resistance protein TerC
MKNGFSGIIKWISKQLFGVKMMTIKKALLWVAFWMGLAAAFDAGIYFFLGKVKALEFLGGYIIEQSLSLDNLFLFLLIFSGFGIPAAYQRRVLNYGIIGAVILRLIFIVLGVALVKRFEWILPIFGLILIISGIKIFFKTEEAQNFKESRILKLLAKIMPISAAMEGERFFIKRNRVLYASPLLAILVLIEGSDIIFAIDSIPAIFSLTTDPFIVYTSNIFAILGLRSIYFLIEKLHHAFHLVKYGVAVILVFVGIKLSILIFGAEKMKIPIDISIAVIFGILLLSILGSVLFKDKESVRD